MVQMWLSVGLSGVLGCATGTPESPAPAEEREATRPSPEEAPDKGRKQRRKRRRKGAKSAMDLPPPGARMGEGCPGGCGCVPSRGGTARADGVIRKGLRNPSVVGRFSKGDALDTVRALWFDQPQTATVVGSLKVRGPDHSTRTLAPGDTFAIDARAEGVVFLTLDGAEHQADESVFCVAGGTLPEGCLATTEEDLAQGQIWRAVEVALPNGGTGWVDGAQISIPGNC